MSTSNEEAGSLCRRMHRVAELHNLVPSRRANRGALMLNLLAQEGEGGYQEVGLPFTYHWRFMEYD